MREEEACACNAQPAPTVLSKFREGNRTLSVGNDGHECVCSTFSHRTSLPQLCCCLSVCVAIGQTCSIVPALQLQARSFCQPDDWRSSDTTLRPCCLHRPVLLIVYVCPAGHGPLSGQPVLSEAAQQEHITRADIRAAAAAATSDAPELKPPKPRKGLSGWVRRHLSLNVNAPWRAGKSAAGMVGIRGCCGGGPPLKAHDGENKAGQSQQQPQGEQQYQSWME